MRRSYLLPFAMLISLPAIGSGCTSSNDSQLARQSKPAEHSVPARNIVSISEASISDPADPESTSPEEKFKPPFAHRQDPFRRPDFKALAETQRRDTASPIDVRLMGFVNLGEAQALLAINGKVSAIEQGAKMEGIEVIEIAPPRVVLQQGRFRWTESLFDEH